MSGLDRTASGLLSGGRTSGEVYGLLLRKFVGAPYAWGGSGLSGTDCSGSVCACLSLATGRPLRVTADELYRRQFTEDAAGVGLLSGRIAAAFFLDAEGRAVHVAGHMGGGLFLNASSIEEGRRARVRTWPELCRMYPGFVPRLRVYTGDGIPGGKGAAL